LNSMLLMAIGLLDTAVIRYLLVCSKSIVVLLNKFASKLQKCQDIRLAVSRNKD